MKVFFKSSFVIVCLIICMGLSKPASAADYWSYPLPMDKWYISWDFGKWLNGWGYHLGQDFLLKNGGNASYQMVKNARWGYVRHVGKHTSFGWVVIIESPREYEASTDPSKWKNPICQVYGHLRDDSYLKATKEKLNKVIDRGTVIGRLGTKDENGGWTPHLHYGTRKGRYTSTWVYYGYSTSTTVLSQWNKPSWLIDNY